jgi:hypothetical protein
VHRLRADQEQPAARASGLKREGCPQPHRTGRGMSRHHHRAPSAMDAAMPLQELEQWLQERAERHPVAWDSSRLTAQPASGLGLIDARPLQMPRSSSRSFVA